MQLISQKISTSSATMAIINSKKATSGPLCNLLKLRFNNIKNNWNSIFIIIPDNTLMRISSITTHHPILFASKLSRMITSQKPIDLFLFHFHILLLLLDSHNKPPISSKLGLALRLSQITLFFNPLMRSRWLRMSLQFITIIPFFLYHFDILTFLRILDISSLLRFVTDTWTWTYFVYTWLRWFWVGELIVGFDETTFFLIQVYWL